MLFTVPFAHDGVDYELRVLSTPDGLMVRAFRDNQHANRFTYRVTSEDQMDAIQFSAIGDPLVHLLEAAREDIRSPHRWEHPPQ